MLDHYLEILVRKPGALPGSTALAQARAAGAFSAAHERFWAEARRRLGDGAGTRALIGVLLLQRRLPAAVVIEAMNAALAIGSVDAEVVAIEARRIEARRPPARGGAHRRRRPRCAARAPPGRLRRPAGRGERPVSAPMALSEPAAEAAIGAACRALHLPTVRAEAGPLADAAAKERVTHRAYLAEVLSAEVDQRDGRRRARRLMEARFPRLKRLEDFDLAAAANINPATLAALAKGAWIDAGEPVVLDRRLRHRQKPSAHRPRRGRLRSRPAGPLRHLRPARQRASRSRRRTKSCPKSSAATDDWTCSC